MLLFAHLGLTLLSGRFMRWADMAFLALGSMLPDIIDKPLGILAFGTPAAGRTICHTLLFLLVLGALAVYMKDFRVASVFAGVLAHLILDFMWQSPVILLWPLLGNFPLARELGVLDYMLALLNGLRNPMVWGARDAGAGLSDLLSIRVQISHSRPMGDFASLLLEHGGCDPDSAQRRMRFCCAAGPQLLFNKLSQDQSL